MIDSILYDLKHTYEPQLTEKGKEKILDHIVEQDKEIERLKNTIDSDNDVIKNQDLEIERLKESEEYHRKGYAELYKRIDEAIEYIENNDIMKVSKEKDTKGSIFCDSKLLDILKGDDKK